MRIWSIHPQYLDCMGLSGAWREALLIRKILRGGTKAYRNHPQVQKVIKAFFTKKEAGRFMVHCILELQHEGKKRGYEFRARNRYYDLQKFLCVSDTQILYEMAHLQAKLWKRDRVQYHLNQYRIKRDKSILVSKIVIPDIINSGIASWERPKPESLKMMEKVRRWMKGGK